MTPTEKNTVNLSNETALHRLIIEKANEGIWMIDAAHKTNFVNDKMSEMLGYSVEEMMGKSMFDFMDQEGIQIAETNVDRRKSGIAESHEFKLISKDGREVWTHMNTGPILENEVYKGALAMVTNITESKLRIQEEKEISSRYFSLFENSPVPIWDEDFSLMKIYIDEKKAEGITDFRAYFTEHPDKLVECTAKMIVNDVNKAVVTLNEANSKEHILSDYNQLLTKDSAEYAIEQLVAISENRTSCEFDAELKTFGGNIRYVHMKWNVVKGHEHDYKRVYLSTSDMTRRIIAENLSLQHANREKAVLLKEIHHRVKNNLQIISSLLNLQSGSFEEEGIRDAFDVSLSRIRSMATVHEMLYKSNDFSGVDFEEYLDTLINSLVESMKGDANNIKIDLNVKNIKLNINTSIPLGLLINEIITNSLKHGIAGDQDGEIYVNINPDNDGFIMHIGDNGKGILEDYDISSTDSLGLQLVTSLTDQLYGELKRDLSKKGVHYIIRFKELKNN
ncbi:MAG: histidine kinase dimerization/phosphoacceptor domain -containing protein [Crocinitomicaceae bacterium]|nr:histidine kinase dimerization/phosphoacceptor domain -containing protein [Crocinitomicaceae bacterium]